MPTNKDLKRLVRARMAKTGESYTAALAHVRSSDGAEAPPLPDDYEKLAGMSDDAVRARTGRGWPEWVAALDAQDATAMSHRDIARWVGDNHDISAWWAQTVTVAYERIRGLRDIGQRRGGLYEANKSRTFDVPATMLYRAFAEKRRRRRWLTDADPTVRTSRKDHSVRFAWEDGTTVDVRFTARGDGRAQVAVQHEGLADRAAMERARKAWAARLGALQDRLAGSGGGTPRG